MLTKRYWLVLFTYAAIQFSAFIGAPLLMLFNLSFEEIVGTWSVISFSVGFIIILFLLAPDIRSRHEVRNRSSRIEAAIWAIFGVLLAFGAQYAAIFIEMNIFGIEPGSENTAQITDVAKAAPIFIIVLAVIGPILEEIVFRKVIFGSLYKRFNFFISALISALIFSAVHWDFEHTLIYTAVGFAFAYLYVKTKRILVPIVAHVAVNSFVVIVQVVYGERLEELQRQLEQVPFIIGGFIQ